MPRSRSLPVLGPEDINLARLSPKLKKILQRRARRAAKRRYAPEIAALRGQKRALRRSFRREKQAIQGTADLATEALTGIPLRGLRGAARRQVGEDLAARATAIQGSVPLLTAEARQNFQTAKGDIQADIIGARVDKAQAAADKYESLYGAAQTDAQSAIKERETRRRDRREERREGGEVDEGLRNAVIAARDALAIWESDPKAREVNALRTPEDWRRFAAGLTATYEGVSLRDAVKALRRVASSNPAANPQAAGPVRP